MKRIICVLLVCLLVFQMGSAGLVSAAQISEYSTASSGTTEPRPELDLTDLLRDDNDDDGEAYLSVGIQVGEDVKTDSYSPVELTAYSRYQIVVRYHPSDRKESKDVSNVAYISVSGSPTVSRESPNYLECYIKTTQVCDDAITVYASYTDEDGEYLEDECQVRVSALKIANASADANALRYAALSNVAYTRFSQAQYGKTIDQLLQEDVYLHQQDEYIHQDNLGASMASFYSGFVGDVQIIDQQITAYHHDFHTTPIVETLISTLFFDPQTESFVIGYSCTDVNELSMLGADIDYYWVAADEEGFQNALSAFDSFQLMDNVTLVGHSLGGAMAIYVSAKTNQKAYTYNAPNMFLQLVQDLEVSVGEGGSDFRNIFDGVNGKRYNYVNGNDILQTSGRTWGGNYTYWLKDQSGENGTARNSLPRYANHGIQQMLSYNVRQGTVRFVIDVNQSNFTDTSEDIWMYREPHHPETYQCYSFGSTNNDILVLASGGYGSIFAGDGNDILLIADNNLPATMRQFYVDTALLIVDVISGVVEDEVTEGKLCYQVGFMLLNILNLTVTLPQMIVRPMPDHIYPGKGNDIINSARLFGGQHYYYQNGDGFDRIYDPIGNDSVMIYGFDEIDYEVIENGEYLAYLIYARGVDSPLMLISAMGEGYYSINLNGITQFNLPKIGTDTKTVKVQCPVDVEIFDGEGNLVHTLKDGMVGEDLFSFGYAAVYEENGEYVKSLTLLDNSYSYRIVGVGDGTMEYTYSEIDAEGNRVYRTVQNVPVSSGASYTPAEDLDQAILYGDLDSDGVNDYTAEYVKPKTVSLSQSKAELDYGQKLTLQAAILPANAQQDMLWSSSNPDVATVDEHGVVTAVGIGEAVITGSSLYEVQVEAQCTVTVPEIAISAEELTITGISSDYNYTGEAIQPEPTVSYQGLVLEYGKDYLLHYENNIQPGSASITISGINLLHGEVTYTYRIGDMTVDFVVQQAAQECLDSGAEGDYEKALWLHDWLTMRANYDFTYTEYTPSGVLLRKTGVCQSYADAYKLLLDAVGIENQIVIAPEMDHAWNLAKLEGEWCHIDCTWDDPAAGGLENHSYFGLNDGMMRRDHTWNEQAYPTASSTKNLYLVRMGEPVVASDEELYAYLMEMAQTQTPAFQVNYIGEQADFSIMNLFVEWFKENNWKYGLASYSISGTAFEMHIEMGYTEPWEKPSPLEEPVAGTPFDLHGPDGRFQSENYTNNGVLMLFSRSYDNNLLQLLRTLSENDNLKNLRESGVEVLVNLLDYTDTTAEMSILSEFPDMHFTFVDSALLWSNLRNVQYSGSSVSLPVVFIYNKDGMITYYSTGDLGSTDVLLGEAYAVSTGSEVPPPSEWLDPEFEPVPGIDFSLPGIGKNETYQEYRDHGLVVIFGRSTCGNTASILDRLQNYTAELLDEGIEIIVNLDDCSDEASLAASGFPEKYPGMIFTYDPDGNDPTFFQMLYCVGDGDDWVTLPGVFVYNGSCMITHYSLGYVPNVQALLEAMRRAAKECAHLNTTHYPAVSSNCTVQGNAAYTRCDDCGLVTEGSSAKLPLDPSCHGAFVEVPSAPYLQTPATCVAPAVYFKSCTLCGAAHAKDTFTSGEALGHNYVKGICTRCGHSNITTIATGYSGNTSWVLDSTGTITFSGNGAMKNYTNKTQMPWYPYREQIRSVVLEEGVTSIGNYAFYGMPALEEITIASTVTTIGNYAFKGSEKLDHVVLPVGLTKLGESAFYGCTSLSSIEIPASLWTIQPYTFKNCTNLKTLTLKEGNLMKISDGAFYGTGLTELIIPACVDIVDVYTFKNCADLASITFAGTVTQIREASFYGTAISEITIPEGVTSIGSYAFKNCTNLHKINLPSTLTKVGEAGFYACTALESLELPDQVATIGNYAFRKCAALKSVKLSAELRKIGESAFYGCEGLTELVIPGKVTAIQGYAFKGCIGLTNVELSESVTTLGESAFYGCTGLTNFSIPASVSEIGDYCFSRSTGIQTVTFEGNAPTIGSGTFSRVVATVYYPSDNATWTDAKRQNYGGTLTWIANKSA